MTQRLFKAEAIILRTHDLGEADRLVTMLSRYQGKFVAVARGARKAKSKLSAGVDIFSYGNFSLYRGKTWPIITGQEAIQVFNWFREDPELYYYGLYLAELTDKLVAGEDSCPDIFLLLLESWILLSFKIDRSLLCRAFELKVANLSGYRPGLNCCITCGASQCQYFSPGSGGLVCSGCLGSDGIRVDAGTIALAKRILDYPLSKVRQIQSSQGQKEQLKQITTLFYRFCMDIDDIKSKRLLPE